MKIKLVYKSSYYNKNEIVPVLEEFEGNMDELEEIIKKFIYFPIAIGDEKNETKK